MSIYESRKPKSSSDDHISQPPKTSTFKPPVVQTQSVEAEPPMPVYRSIIDDFLTNNPFQQVPGEPASGQRRLSPIRIPSVSAEVQRQGLVQLNPLKGAAKADEALELAQKELAHLNREMALEMAQAAADLAGIADPTPISDGISAAISLAKGDYLGAGLSLVSMVPYLGDAVGKPGKIARNARKLESLLQRMEELTQQIHKLNPALERKASEAMGEGLEAVKKVLDRPYGQYTKLSQPGGLEATEGKQILDAKGRPGPPSHSLTEHGPEKLLVEIEQRIIQGKQAATKFIDRAKMESAISDTIDTYKVEIDMWLKSGFSKSRAFRHSPGMGNLGEGYYRNTLNQVEKIPYDLESLTVVLKPDGNGNYIIQTAFPIK
ncbi:RNase A-like domain-containing protein [Anthocerotibacter panamensis]|uniref:RNase A-like domain-containing protein n=1 Tax=Anthocerotibacter panamensis TaxID=2857077 RepID=UPI001C405F14|nr:RNase A-like domain-containing protein [Anthocerotibacter panamensis]